MKLIYIANARIPTEKAHGINIVQMCHALGVQGVDVTLVLPSRKNSIDQDIFSYYGINNNFAVEYLKTVDFISRGFFGYWMSQISFTIALLFRCWQEKDTIILTRDEWSGWFLALFGHSVYYDMHGFPVKWVGLWKMAMKKMSGIICTNNWKLQKCFKEFGISKERLVLGRNGFVPSLFNEPKGKEEARNILGLPVDKKIAVYAGHLYDWKGVDVLVAAAGDLSEVLFLIVGGSGQEISELEKRVKLCDNVRLLGQKPFVQIPLYLRAADVLVLPNSAKSDNPRFADYSVYDTSPIKMFEYMASERPIVASDLPAIAEVLNTSNAIMVRPDNLQSLAKGILLAVTDSKLAQTLALKALADVKEYTWEKRAQIILNFITKSTNG